MKNFLLLISLILLMQTTQAQSGTTAFINGKIYTVNEKQPLAEAVIIEGNKIIFVGSTQEAKQKINEKTKVHDLNGRLMLPGFIDNHVHFTMGGFYLQGINLRQAKSTTEFKQIIKEYVEKYPGKWVTSGNWDHEAWETKELPTKEMIDDVSPNTPVFVDRFDGHMGLANSYALKLAGITKNTPNPDGGLIVKDPKTGEPTGMLKDNAMTLVYKIVPAPTFQENEKAVFTALNHAKELGITSVQDITSRLDLETYSKLENENSLTCRIYTRYPIDDFQYLVNKNVKANTGSIYLKNGSLKAFADGSLGSSTAWFFERYDQDTLTAGLAMDIITNGNLRKWAEEADSKGLQLSIHAIGDQANYYILKMYEEIAEKNPQWDRRFRIEHAQHIRDEDIPLFVKTGTIASVQPYHAIDDGVWAEKRIGKERVKEMYPFNSFLNSGVKLCFGTDWTVAPLNPLLGIYAAVTRRTLDDKNPDGWIPEEKISVEDAIKCYTINNAYASFEEDIKGSIEVGKLADLVVLNEDILTIATEKIKDVKVEMTIFDGKIIFEKK